MVKRYVQRAIDNEFYAIHPYYPIVDKEFVNLAHKNGLKVNVFTVNALLNRTLGRTNQ